MWDNVDSTQVYVALGTVLLLSQLAPWRFLVNLRATGGTAREVVTLHPVGIVSFLLPQNWRWPKRVDAKRLFLHKFNDFEKHRSTGYWMVSPFAKHPCLMLADGQAIADVGSRPDVFGKPEVQYDVLCIWGGNLVAKDGAEWRRHRKVVGPTFTEANNKIVWNETIRICDLWFTQMDDSGKDTFDEVDVTEKCMLLALMVISSAGFGVTIPWDTAQEVVPRGHEMTFTAALRGVIDQFLTKIITPKWMYRLPIKGLQRAQNFYAEFEQYMREMIDERRLELAQGVEAKDLFAALIKGSSEEKGSAALTEEELMSNIYVMLIAGHETTGHTLASALLMLAVFPEHQDLIRKEAEELFNGDEPPPYSSASDLKYTIATFHETLRLFPPLTTVPKHALSDTTLTIRTQSPDGTWSPSPIFIPKGSDVRFDVNALHYSPLQHSDPAVFRPSRFLDAEEKKWDRQGLAGFSTGARGCIGKAFAVVEASAALAKIVCRYEVRLLPGVKERYERKEGEGDVEYMFRIHNAQNVMTLTPQNLGISFVKRA